MKLFFAFLKEKRRSLIFFAVCLLFLMLSFSLYDLPAEAVCYPLCLCALLGILLLLTEFAAAARKHRQMEEMLSLSHEMLSRFPESRTIAEADCLNLLRRLCRELEDTEREDRTRYMEALDYYTVWAHQIKTPIAAMKLRLEREDNSLAWEMKGELQRIEQYADMVMAYLRLEEGEGDYVFRELDLDNVLRGSIRRFSSEFISKHLTLSFIPTGKKLVSDEKWLQFVVEQLLSNAVKYTSGGGISVFLTADTLVIEDTGIGIAPEDLPRIFEKGYTGYNGRKDKRASGIGLYLCKRVCERLGIGLRCESRVGEGTKMLLELPAGECDSNVSSEEKM